MQRNLWFFSFVSESADGFCTPPSVSADTCDSGFNELFSKAGTSTSSQPEPEQVNQGGICHFSCVGEDTINKKIFNFR